ncbi:tRNA dihydrouridine synthase DusB [Haliangium sp.]|uniref:tRNA dihydrouridine synthase DusB n=1 Tax=Haliangium sp. TaxID=2663208 RepID=UPI003D11C532
MRVGPIELSSPVLLAPMAAVTNLPFRTICERFGVGLTITEFLSADALSAGDPKAAAKLTASLGGAPFGVQIYGREDEPMQRAARMAVRIGAALVDINMGCPKKRVVAGVCGSALMQWPAMAQRLVRAVIEAVPAHVPVTVKHRAGWDERHRNAPEFACAMVEAGATMITVHGRTRTQGFSGSADLDIIRRVRAAVPGNVPVVGNGDVVDVDGYRRMRAHTGCDAVMIGRGALGNPWLFRRIREVEQGRPDPGPPSVAERREVFWRHVGLIEACEPLRGRIHELRKAGVWYTKGLRGVDRLRRRMWQIHEPAALIEAVEGFFADRLGSAPATGVSAAGT